MSEVDEKRVMITLSTRAKEAIKTALAIVIAFSIPLSMGWDHPAWPAVTLVTLNMMTTGQSLPRSIMRTSGTLVGGVAALVLLSLFPLERWWFMVGLSLFVGFCTYMLKGKTIQYFWFLAAITCLVIPSVSLPLSSQSAFDTAVMRTVLTAVGALVWILVAAFLWPRSSIGPFKETGRKLWATQARLYRTYRDLMSGKGTAEDSRPLRLQEIEQLAQVGQLLVSAEADSYAVWEARRQWRRFHQQSTTLMETLERWRGSFAEIQSLNLNKFLPNLEAVCAELDLRFGQIGRMLVEQAPTRTPQPITLAVDKAEMRALTRFQQAAVVVTQTQLENLERISRSLFDCVADIKGYTRQVKAPAADTRPRRGPAIDPDRFRAAMMVVGTLWIAFLLWVYVDPPGDSGFVMFAGIFALILQLAPQAGMVLMFLSWGGGIVFAGLLYVFVMPHLSGYGELVALLFGAYFAMYYLLGEPRQTLARIMCMVSFAICLTIDNQQTYSFASYLNTTAMILLTLPLAIAATYIPASPRPEKVFLRLLRRFFRHARFLLAGLAPDRQQQTGAVRRLQSLVYQNDLLEVPGKLAACGKQIDYRAFPENTPEQVHALVAGLYAVANRIKDLVDANAHSQAQLVRERLRDDLHSWHQVIEARLKLRAEDPTQFIEPSADVRARLADRLAKLEASIEAIFDQSGKGELSTADSKNLYRLLGSYRGLSEAAIGYAQLAEGIDWTRWHETRF